MPKIENKTTEDTLSFYAEKENKTIKDNLIRDTTTFPESEKEDYYKPRKTVDAFNEFKSGGVKKYQENIFFKKLNLIWVIWQTSVTN